MSVTLQWISIGIMAVLIIVMVLRTIPWKKIFFAMYGNKKEKGLVRIISNGVIIDERNARLVYTEDCGDLYYYTRWKEDIQVTVQANYPELYHEGRREIYVMDGSIDAVDIFKKAEDRQGNLDVARKVTDGAYLDVMFKALALKKGFKLNWTLIIIAVLAIGAFVWWRMSSGEAQPVTPGSSNQTKPSPTVRPTDIVSYVVDGWEVSL